MDVVDVIRTKRDGKTLSTAQIGWFISSYTEGRIADEQASALLMAIVWRGMEPGELAEWTAAMLGSGIRLDLSSIERPTADKHSTGGVGDKVSLPLAPMVAAAGLADPMLSGRGLGHTGGTLDKLETIPGFKVDLSSEEMLGVLREVGCVICSAGQDLAPADRKLYALRDVTGTVESIPLIASSIMSKKIAEGTDALVLDVKVGSGAFLPSLQSARELAETMVQLGQAHGVKTSAVLTDMDQPLGRTIGNAIEVTESVLMLDGGETSPDLAEVTFALAEEMFRLAEKEADPRTVLSDGSARRKWDEMVRAQGGDPKAPLAEAPHGQPYLATSGGIVQRVDARKVGIAAWRLGAGRSRKEDPVSPSAGVILNKVAGDPVEEGEPMLYLLAEDEARFEAARQSLEGAVEIGPEPPAPREMIIETIRP